VCDDLKVLKVRNWKELAVDRKFQVLAAASMKFRVFWDVLPCSSVEVDDVSEVRTAVIIRAMNPLMMEAVRISETSVNFNVTARRYTQKTLKTWSGLSEKAKTHKGLQC
jgi:hypothetical protein